MIVCFDARIIREYREVLARKRFGFEPAAIDDFLGQLESHGKPAVGEPLRRRLPDRSDEKFLEVAIAAEVDALTSGNLKHFPSDRRCGVAVLSPAELLRTYSSRRSRSAGHFKV